MSPNSLENPDSSFRLTAAMLIKNPTEVLNNLGRLIFTIEEKKNRPKFMLEGRKSSIHSISIDRPKTAFKLGRLAFQATQRYLAIKFMNSSEQFKLLKLIAILLDIKKIIRLAETEHSMEDLTDLMNNFFFGIRLEVEESGINHISFFSLLFVFERSESEDYIDTETSRRIFMMRNLISLLSKKKYLINMSIFEKQDFLDSCLSDHEIIKDALLVMSSNLNYINFEALESFLFCLYDQSKEKFKFINCILSISQYFQKYDVDLSRHMSAIAQKLSVKFGRPKSAERESFSAIEATDHGISTTHSSQIEHLLDRLAILSTKDAPLLDNQSLSDISICFERVLKERFIPKEKLQSILSCLGILLSKVYSNPEIRSIHLLALWKFYIKILDKIYSYNREQCIMRQTTLLISRESIGQISHAPLLDHFEFALNIRAYSPDILIISIINSLQETSCPIDEKRHYQLIARIIVNIFLRHLFDIIYEQEAKHDKCDEILIKNKQMLARLNQNKIYEHCLDLLMKCEHPSAYTLMELLYNFKDKIFDLDAMRARNGTTYFYRKQEKMHDSWQLSEFSNLFLGGIPNQKTKVTLSWRLFISDLSKEYLIKLSLFLDFCQGAIDKPEDAKILNYIRRKLSTKLRLTQDGAEYLESLAGYSAKDFHHPGFNYRELQHVANRLPIFITEFLKSPNGMGCLNQEMIVCRIKEELSYHSDREINQDSPIQKDPNYLPIKETTTYYKARQKYLY